MLSHYLDELQTNLIPDSGKCETLEGEILRAGTKLCYAYYNNGFAYNCSGAWAFLARHSCAELYLPDVLSVLQPYCHGGVYSCAPYESMIEDTLIQLMCKILCYISSKHRIYTSNTEDMMDYTTNSNNSVVQNCG